MKKEKIYISVDEGVSGGDYTCETNFKRKGDIIEIVSVEITAP